MFIADQDQASRVGEDAKWETKLASGVLKYHGNLGEGSYTLTAGPEARLYTRRGDKDGRGAEYSALELFDGKLLTMCDRTGNCDEIKITADGTLDIVPLVDAAGLPVAFRMGDGKKDKALKVEWATKKDGVLVVGSTGKERTDDDGNVVHELTIESDFSIDLKIKHQALGFNSSSLSKIVTSLPTSYKSQLSYNNSSKSSTTSSISSPSPTSSISSSSSSPSQPSS
jgi:hypothetical protein